MHRKNTTHLTPIFNQSKFFQSMTTKELVQVTQWIDEGVCEYFYVEGWQHYPRQMVFSIRSDEPFSFYRCKPNSTLRPWRPEEVPVGALLKHTMFIHAQWLIIGRDDHGSALIMDNNECTWITHYIDYQVSLDHCITWKPCGVME